MALSSVARASLRYRIARALLMAFRLIGSLEDGSPVCLGVRRPAKL